MVAPMASMVAPSGVDGVDGGFDGLDGGFDGMVEVDGHQSSKVVMNELMG